MLPLPAEGKVTALRHTERPTFAAEPAEILGMDSVHNPGSSRRVAPRYPASLPCSLAWDSGEVDAVLSDLSLTGAAVIVQVVPVEMRRSDLSLVLDGTNAPIEVAAHVVGVEREPFGGCLIRLRFQEVTFEQAHPLARLVTELRMEFNEHQAVLANDRIGHPHPSRIPQYPPRDRQK